MGCRTEPLQGKELWALAWVLPPVAVLVAAHLVFDLVGASYAVAASVLAREPATGEVATLLQAGFGWSTAALVYLVAAAGCIVAAVRIIRSRVRGAAARPFRNLAMGLAALGLAHLAVVEVLGLPLRTIFDLTMDRLVVAGVLESWQLLGVRAVVGAINLSSVIVPALIATAAAATALPPRDGWDEASLVLRSREVKQTVAIAATFMVAGVLHMGAWTHWADAMVAGGDVGRLATGVTLYWGAVFTLMIAAFYLPMATVLRELAEAELDRQAIRPGERSAWLASRELSFQASHQLPQIAAMAAPLLAGPLSEAVRAGVSQLGL